ncbi:MAG: hypothetical protein CMO35_04995 [Verrucomicrobiaceae bacterium]|jgi:hypothetical protein|nr:hypothetical protein [Verrucomicrobiaceae bacterium]MBB08025.1 hypothetical protein [Roseibacillus sp.]
MLARVLVAIFLLSSPSWAVTLEVVNLYQPLSLHGTDGVGETLGLNDPVQAAVMSRPYAVTGAMPEDLVKAVAVPHRIATNGEGYDVRDANLLNLCRVALGVEMQGDRLLVRLDVSKFTLQEELDLSARQVLTLSIIAIERTLRDYFRDAEDVSLKVSIGIKGTTEGNAGLRDLARRFRIGNSTREGAEEDG